MGRRAPDVGEEVLLTVALQHAAGISGQEHSSTRIRESGAAGHRRRLPGIRFTCAELAWHHQTTMATAPRQRRKHTISQAKNRMRRTVDEIIDPGPANIDALWEHFEGRCAYCGGVLSRSAREGHVDRAEAGGGNHLGNLVLSCGICNGDDKREESWREFLRRTTTDDAVFADRETRIQEWLDENSRALIADSPEIAALRGQIEALVDQFAIDCHELKRLVRKRIAPPS